MEFQLPDQIEKCISQFTGRTWLLPHLIEWLEQTDERMFLLAGKPGTGKSMITAWLTS